MTCPGATRSREGPLAALDLEATGVSIQKARIVKAGLVRFEPDGSSETLVDRLIDPGASPPPLRPP